MCGVRLQADQSGQSRIPQVGGSISRTVALFIVTLLTAQLSQYSYTLPDGKTITLNFPLFVEGNGPKVTKDVFRGYTLYNSYCYRCHGQDVTESQLGPNLRHSLESMTPQQFLAVAKFGREDKGMPSWGGFLTEEEMTSIYRYVKGRSLELVPVGRPPSEFD